MHRCYMKKDEKKPGRIIKYQRNRKNEKPEILEAALRRILTLESSSEQLTVADTLNKTGRNNTTFLQWKNPTQPIPNNAFINKVRDNNERYEKLIKENVKEPNKIEISKQYKKEKCVNISSQLSKALEYGNESGRKLTGYSSKKSILTSSEESIVMDPTSDSIIWNNKSAEQLESNVSLVVNPPSSISQHEDSILSDDSQYAKSGIDLVLEDERRWMKYRVENLTRDECIIICVLAQMILSDGELPGTRDMIPNDEEAKQSLLYLCYGGCWELNNLKSVLDLAECLPVGLRRLYGLGVRDRGQSARKMLESRLEQCLDLGRRLSLQQAI